MVNILPLQNRFAFFLPRVVPRALVLLLCVVVFSSCASIINVQPTVNSLVIAGRFERALKVLAEDEDAYGRNNQLLYFLDQGMVLHLAGRYQESIETFARAKQKFSELYAISLSKAGLSLLINDYTQPYRGEDFERVLVNIFQALNYAALGDIEGALVEARDVDSILQAINLQYAPDQKNVYRKDAFARFLMGILYEASGTDSGLNDAFISYREAVEIYQTDYAFNYGVQLPALLRQNLLSSAEFMGTEETRQALQQLGATPYVSLADKEKKCEVYLIHYNGLAPIKLEGSLAVPLPDRYLAKVAFPRYKKRVYDEREYVFSARDSSGRVLQARTEPGQDISSIAIRNLANRQARLIAKSVARSAGKYLFARAQEENIRKKNGDTAAELFNYGMNLFNFFSEQADIRSWQTLPAEIRIARLLLKPGKYEFSLNGRPLGGPFSLRAGEKKFLFTRTSR